MRLTRTDTLLARLHALGLANRGDDLAAAVAAGLRDAPAGTYRDAFAARLTEASTRRLFSEAGKDRRHDEALVGVWGPRAAPYVVARADVGVFTRGGLPTTDASEKAYAPSAIKALAPGGRALLEAATEVEEAMVAAVAGGPVERDAMHEQLREALPGALLWACKGCGTNHVHPSVWRTACAYGRVGRVLDTDARAVTYTRVAAPPDPGEDAAARAELTRRALHHHGPLTAIEFAAWLSLSKAEAGKRLEAVSGELTEVDRDGTDALALTRDLAVFEDPEPIRGLRLLGPGDPLLDGRDRTTLIPDRAQQKEVWKILGNPGLVLQSGRPVGTWRAKAKSRRLELTLTPFGDAPLPAANSVQPEADRLAAARGREDGAVLV